MALCGLCRRVDTARITLKIGAIKMSRKHYNMIANAINSQLVEGETYYKFEIAQIIATALKGSTPKYDSVGFYRAAMGIKPARKPRKR